MYRDIIWVGWIIALGFLFIPCFEAVGVKTDVTILFLAHALILGFLSNSLISSLLLLPLLILCWILSQTELSFLFANFKNLTAELRIFSLLTTVKSTYIKMAEFGLLTFVMSLGSKLSFAIGRQIRSSWKKVLAISFLFLFFGSLGGVAFWFKIFQDTNLGDMVAVPSGKFMMGTESDSIEELAKISGVDKERLLNEQPQRVMFLQEFYIDKFEVTNNQYKKFIYATGYKPPDNWVNGTYPLGKGNYPVVGVSLMDATAYAKWAGKRIPTEMEWEKAARGDNGKEYPWGSSSISWSFLGLFSLPRCNIETSKKYGTGPVGSYIHGRSPWGAYDMAGNAMEWVDSVYKPYPDSKHWDDDYKKGYYVLRGGSWYTDRFYARSAARIAKLKEEKSLEIGFRCVLSVKKDNSGNKNQE